MTFTNQPAKRKRGRPATRGVSKRPLNEIIIEAARQVCCDKGVHALTVELILRKAGISRPTFYKFFKNKDEVLDLISKDVNQKLVDALSRVFVKQHPDEAGFIAMIDAYLDWGMAEGAIVGRLYQAIKDETSLVSKNRKETVAQVILVLQEALIISGLQQQDPVLLDALINTVEYLCNPLFTKEHSDDYFNRVRQIVLNMIEKLFFK